MKMMKAMLCATTLLGGASGYSAYALAQEGGAATPAPEAAPAPAPDAAPAPEATPAPAPAPAPAVPARVVTPPPPPPAPPALPMTANGRALYVNADGSAATDLEAAAATWRALPEFQADHAKAQIRAEYAYARGITGAGVRVGVLDDGLERTHPAWLSTANAGPDAEPKLEVINVAAQVALTHDVRARAIILDGRPNYDAGSLGHGTHVSGTIAGPRDNVGFMGVAPDSRILSGTMFQGTDFPTRLRAFHTTEPRHRFIDGTQFTTDAIYASEVQFINNSYGARFGRPVGEETAEGQGMQHDREALRFDAALEDVLAGLGQNAAGGIMQGEYNRHVTLANNVRDSGKIMVYAAGNHSGEHASALASIPLIVPEVERNWLAVVNMDVDGVNANAGSSLCGQTRAWCLAAPGTDIVSALTDRALRPEFVDQLLRPPTEEETASWTRREGGVSALGERIAALFLPNPGNNLPENATALEEEIEGVRQQLELVRIQQEHIAGGRAAAEALGQLWAGVVIDATRAVLMQTPALLERVNNNETTYVGVLYHVYQEVAGPLRPDQLNFDLERLTSMLSGARFYNPNATEDDPFYFMHLAIADHALEVGRLDLVDGPLTGTSMAAPHVTGGLALVAQRFPYIDQYLVRDTLLTTAEDRGDPGVDARYGWGMMDIGRAMDGPGGLLRDVRVTVGAGVSDIWANNIIDGSEALGEDYGGGLTKLGAGMLTLTGRNSYLGDTLVQGGELRVNGALTRSHAQVSGTGVLSGTGRLHQLTVGNGGTLAPGQSIGTLFVDGDLVFAAGSTLDVESAVNMSAVDLVAATGTVTINGGNVRVLADQGDWNYQSSADIVTGGAGVTGQFAGVTSNLAFLTPSLSYGSNAVRLGLRRNDVRFVDAASTANQRAAAGALDRLPAGNVLNNALLGSSVRGVGAALDSLTGETHASLAAVVGNDSYHFRDAALRRLPHSVHQIGSAPSTDQRNSAGVAVWAQGLAGFSDRDGSAELAEVKTNSKGFATGIEKSWDDRFQLGIMGGYLDSDARVARLGSERNRVESWHAGGYLGAEAGALRLRAGGTYGWHETESRRSAYVNGFSDQLQGKYEGRSWQAFGEVSLGLDAGGLKLEPFGGVTHVDYRSRNLAEAGGAARLSGQSTYKATLSTLGLRTSAVVLERADGRRGFLRLNGAWRHDLDNDGAKAALRFAGETTPFVVAGAEMGKDVGLVDVALDLPMGRNVDIGITYGGQFSNRYEAHIMKASLTARF